MPSYLANILSVTTSSFRRAVTQTTLPAGYTDKIYISEDWVPGVQSPSFHADLDNLPASCVEIASWTTGGHTYVEATGLPAGRTYMIFALRYNGSGGRVSTWGGAGDDDWNIGGASWGDGYPEIYSVWTAPEYDQLTATNCSDFSVTPFEYDFSIPPFQTAAWNAAANYLQEVSRVAYDAAFDGPIYRILCAGSPASVGPQLFSPYPMWSPLHSLTVEVKFRWHGAYSGISFDIYGGEDAYEGFLSDNFGPGGGPFTGGLSMGAWWYGYSPFAITNGGGLSEDVIHTLRIEYIPNIGGNAQLIYYINGNRCSFLDGEGYFIDDKKSIPLQNAGRKFAPFKWPVSFWMCALLHDDGSQTAHDAYIDWGSLKVWGTPVWGNLSPGRMRFWGDIYKTSGSNAAFYNGKDGAGGGVPYHQFYAGNGVSGLSARSAANPTYQGWPSSFDMQTYEWASSMAFPIHAQEPKVCVFNVTSPKIQIVNSGGFQKSFKYLRVLGRQGSDAGEYIKVQVRDVNGNLFADNLLRVISPAARTAQVNSTGFRAYADYDFYHLTIDLSGLLGNTVIYLDITGEVKSQRQLSADGTTTPVTGPPLLQAVWVEIADTSTITTTTTPVPTTTTTTTTTSAPTTTGAPTTTPSPTTTTVVPTTTTTTTSGTTTTAAPGTQVLKINVEGTTIGFAQSVSGELKIKLSTGNVVKFKLGGTGPVRIKMSDGSVKSIQ